MHNRKIIGYIGMAALVLFTGTLGVQYQERMRLQQGIAEKVLRFHVLANSDSSADQKLKLQVRDAIGEKMRVLLQDAGSREICETIVRKQMEEIKKTAEDVIAREGYEYEVEACLDEVDFPVKTYGNYTFPAGKYEALEVVIGEGKGQNWWCVMYPNLCFSGSMYEVVEDNAKEELREVLTDEEYRQIFSDGNYEVRLRCLEFLWH